MTKIPKVAGDVAVVVAHLHASQGFASNGMIKGAWGSSMRELYIYTQSRRQRGSLASQSLTPSLHSTLWQRSLQSSA